MLRGKSTTNMNFVVGVTAIILIYLILKNR